MLKLEHVTKYYGKNVGIKDLSFSIKKGRILGVLGSNGSGKSTTFRILLGLIEMNEGKISYDDQPLDFTNKRLFGYLPEEKSMLRDLKVKDQITYLARLKKIPLIQINQQLDYWLEYLNIEKHRNKKVQSLSKGNVQLVQLACALIHQPEIYIFDEPLNGLDLENVSLFKKLCLKLRDEGKIILISSHQYNNIEDLVDDVVYLDQGECLFQDNLMFLKKQKAIRYLTIHNSDVEDFEVEGCLESNQFGKDAILKIDCEKNAKKFIRTLLKQDNLSFKCEMVSLQYLIKEALHDRTH